MSLDFRFFILLVRVTLLTVSQHMLSSKLWKLSAEPVPEVTPTQGIEEITRYNGIDLTLLAEKLLLQLLLSFLYQ